MLKRQNSDDGSLEKVAAASDVESVDASPQPTMPSYLSQLRIWNGTFTDVSMWKIFLRPFPFLLSPVVRTRRFSHAALPFTLCLRVQTYFVFLSHGMQTVWLSAHHTINAFGECH